MRTTYALLALLAALGGAALLAQGPCATDRVREHGKVFPGLTPAAVRAVKISRAGAEVLLSRAGDAWSLGAERQPADGDAVGALLDDLAAIEAMAVVSKNAARQAEYETNAERGIAVRLEGEGGRIVAAFVVGKRGPDFQSSFLKRDGQKEVLLVSRDVRTPLSRPAEGWKKRPQPAEPAGSTPEQ